MTVGIRLYDAEGAHIGYADHEGDGQEPLVITDDGRYFVWMTRAGHYRQVEPVHAQVQGSVDLSSQTEAPTGGVKESEPEPAGTTAEPEPPPAPPEPPMRRLLRR